MFPNDMNRVGEKRSRPVLYNTDTYIKKIIPSPNFKSAVQNI